MERLPSRRLPRSNAVPIRDHGRRGIRRSNRQRRATSACVIAPTVRPAPNRQHAGYHAEPHLPTLAGWRKRHGSWFVSTRALWCSEILQARTIHDDAASISSPRGSVAASPTGITAVPVWGRQAASAVVGQHSADRGREHESSAERDREGRAGSGEEARVADRSELDEWPETVPAGTPSPFHRLGLRRRVTQRARFYRAASVGGLYGLHVDRF